MSSDYLTRKQAYWFARGYYDGRAFGDARSQDAVDGWSEEVRLAYKQAYDIGVADYCEMDVEENEDGARPDLLAALLVAEAALAAYSGGESSDLDAIRAAIAKATGGAA